ncbi:MAG: hypothetical protein H7Y38_02705 [Armatimonadetes bacterium]|nr:hypothetical protein [Armatimonadota bacterium]
MATASAGRTICGNCGANNFETQAACWKCGKTLAGTGIALSAAPRLADSVAVVAAPATVDPAVAQWTAILGGLLVPIVMLPVGLAFLMWDDRRKVEVGRTATIASLVGTLFHAIFTYFAVAGVVGMAMKMLPGAVDKAKAGQSEPAPDFNEDVKPLELPGIPPMAPAK